MRLASLTIAMLVLVLDLATKWWVKSYLYRGSYSIVDGFFTIQYAENSGIAFGFLDSLESSWKAPLLGLLAVLATAMVLYYIWTTPDQERTALIALGLILGGILGNFIDRLMHTFVVDFIRVHWRNLFAWPTFNVADSAITSGVVLILLLSMYDAFSPQPSVDDGNQA